MKCVVKIMAMPGTRAAVVDLRMFGLLACDDGGPGFVNASVRTITNVRQVGVRVAKQMHRHTSACPGRRRRHDRKEGANGNMGASSRQSIGGTTEKKGQGGAGDAGAEEESGGCKQDMQHHP